MNKDLDRKIIAHLKRHRPDIFVSLPTAQEQKLAADADTNNEFIGDEELSELKHRFERA